MLAKKLVPLFVLVGILGLSATAPAQNGEAPKKKTLVDRLDDFGRTLFGGILPAEKSKPSRSEATSQPEERRSPRRPMASDSFAERDATAESDGVADQEPANTRPENSLRGEPSRRVSEVEKSAQAETEFTPENMPSAVVPSERPASASASRPLHERLSSLRRSPFDAEARSDSSPVPVAAKAIEESQATNQVETVKESAAPEAAGPTPTKRLTLAQRIVPKASPSAAPMTAEPLSEKSVQPVAKSAGDDVLFTRKGPMLSVETMGPRTIAVGRESIYQVYLLNSGEAATEGLVVYVTLPEWAEVAQVEASVGEALAPDAQASDGTIQWKLGRLDAKSRERLTLKIVPRQSRPFDLAVRWESRPTASQAMIEVQEAKLALQLNGPREVLYGKKELYRLRLANTGNGPAENVVLMLTPIGTGANVPASHKVGVLAAGEERSLEVELTARQAGDLLIQAEARADGEVHAELSERVLVRRADLKVEVEGPKVQYVGAVAAYTVRVRNVGSAPARNVQLSIALPSGAKYLSGIEGAKTLGAGDKLDWSIETLNPEVEQTFTLKCGLGTAGAGRLRLSAAADDDLTALAETVVQVEAVANLTMEVQDPTGPVPVGEEAVYEVRVRNRGTKEARNVEVFAYFSRGIEPTTAEGAPSQLGAGQVVFQPIASLAPGEETVLKICAKAETAGNHIFRAEAHCKPLSARLVSEATNLYYGEGLAGSPSPKESAVSEQPPAAAYDAMRTIPRPLSNE